MAAFAPVVFRCPFPPVVNSFSVTTLSAAGGIVSPCRAANDRVRCCFSRRSHIAPQTCTKLHPRSSKVKAIAAFQTAVVIACAPVLPRHRSGYDLLHRHQGVLRPCQRRVCPDLRHLPAVSGEVLRRGVTADRKSAVLRHRTALFSLPALGKRRQEVYNTRNRTGKPEKRRQPHVLSGIPGIFREAA